MTWYTDKRVTPIYFLSKPPQNGSAWFPGICIQKNKLVYICNVNSNPTIYTLQRWCQHLWIISDTSRPDVYKISSTINLSCSGIKMLQGIQADKQEFWKFTLLKSFIYFPEKEALCVCERAHARAQFPKFVNSISCSISWDSMLLKWWDLSFTFFCFPPCSPHPICQAA